MDFSVLLADLRDVAEKYKGRSTGPEVASHAYADMFTQILKKTQNMTEKYEDQITMFRVALNQLSSIYKDLAQGTYRELLINYIFGMCARTVLNIQWSQLDEDNEVKSEFVSSVEAANEILKSQGYTKFQLILNLMESQWTDPTLTQIMASAPDDDEDLEDGEEYIKNEDPQILKLRIEIMMKENCEEFALNLCDWSLKHPQLKKDLKIRENQIVILYKQADYKRMQEVCSQIVCHDGIHVMGRLAKNSANQDLCIRLAQVFLIQDWINPDRNCCTQELLKLWIHHQYLADKDEERFLDSIWTVAKVCRSTRQIGVLIDGVQGECGDMFIQLYTELCKYALNIDKGNMEQEKTKGNKEEVENRKQLLSQTCVRMAHMLKEYDFKMSRICGLTAFSLHPTSDNLNLVNKLYWTIKHTSVTTGKRKIDPATVYEVERLLGLMRPEILNPENTWKQLIPVCKRYQITKGYNNEGPVKKDASAKRTYKKPNILSAMPHVKTPIATARSSPENRKKATGESPKSLQRVHTEKLLAQNKSLSREKVTQLARDKFPKSKEQELPEGPPLTAKKLDSTINDLKKSIVLENQYSANLAKHLTPLAIKEEKDSPKGNLIQGIAHTQEKRPKEFPTSVNKQTSKQPSQHFTKHSPVPLLPGPHKGQVSLPSFVHVISKPLGLSEGTSNYQLSQSNLVPSQRVNPVDELSKKQKKGHFNILRPPGSANQECAKIAQQIAEMHEKQRKEKEALERFRQQGRLDVAKLGLNSRNIPSSSQISDLLSLTMKGKDGTKAKEETETDFVGFKEGSHKDYIKRRTDTNYNSGASAITDSEVLGANTVEHTPQSMVSESEKGKKYNTQKYYLASEHVLSHLKRDPCGNINLEDSKVSIKPVFSMVVPKSLTSPDNQQQLMQTVSNMVKQAHVKPALETTHSMIDNKIMTGNQVTSTFQRDSSTDYGKPIHQGSLYNTHPTTVSSSAHGIVNNQQYSSPSITNNAYQPVIQPAVQTQYATSQPLLTNSVNLVSPNQINPAISQTGGPFMTSNVTYQSMNNTIPVMSQPSLNQQILTMQPGSNTVSQYQQFSQNIHQASHLDQSYLPQQTFSTVPQYGSQQSGYSPTVYHPHHNVIAGQTFMSNQNELLQQQSMVPLVHNNMQDLNSIQNIQMQNFSIKQNSAQPMVHIQPSTNVNKVQPQLNYSIANRNDMPVSKSVPPIQNSAIGQSYSWPMDVVNTGVHQDSSKQSQPKPTAKQFIAPPELSPAVVQQILSSFKHSGGNKTDKPLQQNIRQTDKSSVMELEKNLTQEVIRQLAMNKHDMHVKKSVLEATHKILELRKQYGHGTPSSDTVSKSTNFDLSQGVKSSVPSVALPELPDLGSKEFEIDSILGLDDNSLSSMENAANPIRQHSTDGKGNLIQVKSDKEMLNHIETFLESDAQSGSAQKIQMHVNPGENSNTNQTKPQSTYQNANRIAKERETTQMNDIQNKKVNKKKSGRVKCWHCEHCFKDDEQRQQHIDRKLCKNINSRVEQEKLFTCSICKSTFRTLKELKDHVGRGCGVSDNGTESNISLKDSDYNLVYKCTNCNWINANDELSYQHIGSCSFNLVNNPARLNSVYMCRMCSDVFYDKVTLCKHVNKLCPRLKVLLNQEKAQESIDRLMNENKLQLVKNNPTGDKTNYTHQPNVTKESDNLKPNHSLQPSLVSEQPVVNGNFPKTLFQKDPLQIEEGNIVNGEDPRSEDQNTTQIVTDAMDEDVTNLKEQAELKRMKENFYLEQFTEMELKRKALKSQIRNDKKCDDTNESNIKSESNEEVFESSPLKVITESSNSSAPKDSELQKKDTPREDAKKRRDYDTHNKKHKFVGDSIKRQHNDECIAYSAKRRRRGEAVDIRKAKGLRAKRLIKQKRYLIDEMEPISHDGKKSSEKKEDIEISKRLNKKAAPDFKGKCKACSFQHRKKEMLTKHYIERHDVGFRTISHKLKCKFCVYRIPDTNKMKMKSHIIKSHLDKILKQMVEGKLNIPSPVKERIGMVSSPLTRFSAGTNKQTSPGSPGKSEKMKKHLKALAMRKSRAESLKRITREKLHALREENTEGSESIIGEESESSGSKPERREGYCAIRNQTILQRRGGSSGLNETSNSISSRMRSRSSSQSSRSSLNDALSIGVKKSIHSNKGKIILTRSGRRIRKPETDSSYVTESSNIEDEDFGLSDEEEDTKVGQQKRRRSRRSSRCSDRRMSTEDNYFSDSSDDGSIPRFTRPSVSHARGLRRSQRDKSKTEESNQEQRGKKGDMKGKGSRQTSVSDDEYASSATDITESYNKGPNTLGNIVIDNTNLTIETEESDNEAEKSYSLRRRKRTAVYKDYESSDIDNDSDNSGTVQKQSISHKKSTGSLSNARRQSPRRFSKTDYSSDSKKHHIEENNAEKHNLSILVGPDDDEFIGLKDLPYVPVTAVNTSEITNIETIQRKETPKVDKSSHVMKESAVMESEDEFAFLKSKDPISDITLQELKPIKNPVAFDSEFQKFTTQRECTSDQESIESDICEDDNQDTLSTYRDETSDNFDDIEDVPVIVPKTDFVSAFHKFTQSKNQTNSELLDELSLEEGDKACEGFQGAYQHFFFEQNSFMNKSKRRKQPRSKEKHEKIDLKRKYGIVDCYVKVSRLKQSTIDAFRNAKSYNFSDNNTQLNPGSVLLNDHKTNENIIDLSSIEDDPEYVWIENAESVAEQTLSDFDVKIEQTDCDAKADDEALCEMKEQDQEIVILTETNQDDLCHNPDVVELCIADSSETGVDNIITIVDDSDGCEENEQPSDLGGSSIVFIEVQDDDEVIITHAVDNLEEFPDQINVAIDEDKLEEMENTTTNVADLNVSTCSKENGDQSIMAQQEETDDLEINLRSDVNTVLDNVIESIISKSDTSMLDKDEHFLKENCQNQLSNDSKDTNENPAKSTCEETSLKLPSDYITKGIQEDIQDESYSEKDKSSNDDAISISSNSCVHQRELCNINSTSSQHEKTDEDPCVTIIEKPEPEKQSSNQVDLNQSETTTECVNNSKRLHFEDPHQSNCNVQNAENLEIQNLTKELTLLPERKDLVLSPESDFVNKHSVTQNMYLGLPVNIGSRKDNEISTELPSLTMQTDICANDENVEKDDLTTSALGTEIQLQRNEALSSEKCSNLDSGNPTTVCLCNKPYSLPCNNVVSDGGKQVDSVDLLELKINDQKMTVLSADTISTNSITSEIAVDNIDNSAKVMDSAAVKDDILDTSEDNSTSDFPNGDDRKYDKTNLTCEIEDTISSASENNATDGNCNHKAFDHGNKVCDSDNNRECISKITTEETECEVIGDLKKEDENGLQIDMSHEELQPDREIKDVTKPDSSSVLCKRSENHNEEDKLCTTVIEISSNDSSDTTFESKEQSSDQESKCLGMDESSSIDYFQLSSVVACDDERISDNVICAVTGIEDGSTESANSSPKLVDLSVEKEVAIASGVIDDTINYKRNLLTEDKEAANVNAFSENENVTFDSKKEYGTNQKVCLSQPNEDTETFEDTIEKGRQRNKDNLAFCSENISDSKNKLTQDDDDDNANDIENNLVKDIEKKSMKDADNINDIEGNSVKDADNVNDIENISVKDADYVNDIENISVKDADYVNDIENNSVKDTEEDSVKDVVNVNDIENSSVNNADNVNDIENHSVKDVDNVTDIENNSVKDVDNVNDIENNSVKDAYHVNDIENNSVKDIENKFLKDVDNVTDIEKKSVKDADNVTDIETNSVKDAENVNDIEINSVEDVDNVNDIENTSVKDADNVTDIETNSVKDADNVKDCESDQLFVSDESGVASKEILETTTESPDTHFENVPTSCIEVDDKGSLLQIAVSKCSLGVVDEDGDNLICEMEEINLKLDKVISVEVDKPAHNENSSITKDEPIVGNNQKIAKSDSVELDLEQIEPIDENIEGVINEDRIIECSENFEVGQSVSSSDTKEMESIEVPTENEYPSEEVDIETFGVESQTEHQLDNVSDYSNYTPIDKCLNSDDKEEDIEIIELGSDYTEQLENNVSAYSIPTTFDKCSDHDEEEEDIEIIKLGPVSPEQHYDSNEGTAEALNNFQFDIKDNHSHTIHPVGDVDAYVDISDHSEDPTHSITIVNHPLKTGENDFVGENDSVTEHERGTVHRLIDTETEAKIDCHDELNSSLADRREIELEENNITTMNNPSLIEDKDAADKRPGEDEDDRLSQCSDISLISFPGTDITDTIEDSDRLVDASEDPHQKDLISTESVDTKDYIQVEAAVINMPLENKSANFCLPERSDLKTCPTIKKDIKANPICSNDCVVPISYEEEVFTKGHEHIIESSTHDSISGESVIKEKSLVLETSSTILVIADPKTQSIDKTESNDSFCRKEEGIEDPISTSSSEEKSTSMKSKVSTEGIPKITLDGIQRRKTENSLRKNTRKSVTPDKAGSESVKKRKDLVRKVNKNIKVKNKVKEQVMKLDESDNSCISNTSGADKEGNSWSMVKETGKVVKETNNSKRKATLLQSIDTKETIGKKEGVSGTASASVSKERIATKRNKDGVSIPQTGSNTDTANVNNTEEVEDEEEELFKKRMESVKRARRKSAIIPYESDFNFEQSSRKPAIKLEETQPHNLRNTYFKVRVTGNCLKSEGKDLKSRQDYVQPREIQDFTEEMMTHMRTRSSEIQKAIPVTSPALSLKTTFPCDGGRTSKTTDAKVEIFSPHIFTCDSVKKIKRRASLKETVMSTISPILPTDPSNSSSTGNLPKLRGSHHHPSIEPHQPLKEGERSQPCPQAGTESKTQKDCVVSKDPSQFTHIKSPHKKRNQHYNSLNKDHQSVQTGSSLQSSVKTSTCTSVQSKPPLSTSSSVKTCPSVKSSPLVLSKPSPSTSTAVKTGSSVKSSPSVHSKRSLSTSLSVKTSSSCVKTVSVGPTRKELQKKSMTEGNELCERFASTCEKVESLTRGTRLRSKTSPCSDSGSKVEKASLLTEIKPELTEKGRVARISRKDSKKESNQKSSVKLGKRRRLVGKDEKNVSSPGPTNKVLKPDGTSVTPIKPGDSSSAGQCKHGVTETTCDTCANNRRSRTTSPKPLYDNDRKTVRHVLHGGKVFEITKGSVTERPIQGETEKMGTVRRTRLSKSNTSPESIETSGKRKNVNLNEYIHKTMKEIKKQRGDSTLTPTWTVKKDGRSKSAKKFPPYTFKKSQRS